jgi:AcrR family transcriptional regulator
VPDPSATNPLPPVLAIAWGRAEPATRGPRAGLSPGAIVAAAIEIADADGLAAVSMGKVAERLGYTPMSLYRHVPSKDDLLTLVQDTALGEPPPTGTSAGGWREALARWTRDITVAYRAHLWVLDIPITGPPAMPNQIAWLERALAALAATPLTDGERLSVALVLSGYSRSWAQLTRDLQRGLERSGFTEPEMARQYGQVLARLVDEDRFPAVHAAIRDGLFDDAEEGEGDAGSEGVDVEFEFGLQRILDGIEVYMTRTPG